MSKSQFVEVISFDDNLILSLKSMWICLHIQTRLPDILSVYPFHVEIITLLSKLDSKRRISAELPIDEVDLTRTESTAIYKQNQNYVLEKFGFKVSILYIAQIKRKHGLDVRKHYNISKNENKKVSQHSIEKKEAILDTSKYFNMIKDGF